MRGYASRAIEGQFEAGPHLGSMTSPQRQKKAKFGKFSPKPTDFHKLLKTNGLIAPDGAPKPRSHLESAT
jgi:hypothetical protein